MKSSKLIASVAAGLVLAAASASAVTGSLNDIVVAFTNSYTGATNVEIDVGQLASDGPGSYSLGNVSNYLTGTYGSGWATSSNLGFGAIGWVGNVGAGANGDPKSTNYVSSAWSTTSGTLGVQNSANPYSGGTTIPASSLNNVGSKITTLYNQMADASATVLASNAVALPTATAGSWDASHSPGFLFGKYDDTLVTQLVSNNNGTFAAVDLYKYAPSANPVFLGTLSLDTAGNLSYTVIPEPSTYAAILGVFVLGFAAVRRRFAGELAA